MGNRRSIEYKVFAKNLYLLQFIAYITLNQPALEINNH
jgi:hypothetical protein